MKSSRTILLSSIFLILTALAEPGKAANNDPPLITAVKSENLDEIRQILAQSDNPELSVNITTKDGTTALHWAVRSANRVIMNLLLANNADASATNRYGASPLFIAVSSADYSATMALLNAGANVNQALPEGETLLMTAARSGNQDIIEALINKGAAIEAREAFYGETALIWAVAENHAGAVAALLKAGADINGRSTPTAFKRKSAGLSLLPQGNWTPLMYAARDGAFDSALTLVEHGADLNLSDPDGTTALVFAIINYHYTLAKMLLEHGADPNIADGSGMNALFAAVDMKTLPWTFGRPMQTPNTQMSALALLELLLEKGANPNAQLLKPLMQRAHTNGDFAVSAGSTAFMRAAKAGDIETMTLLLDNGADPDLSMENGNTALMLAAGLGWRDGNMAVPTRDVGTEQEALAAIRLCLSLGADINAVGDKGNTPLHVAVTGRASLPIIRFLLENGASLDTLNESGQNPLDAALASRRDRSAAASLLREFMGL